MDEENQIVKQEELPIQTDTQFLIAGQSYSLKPDQKFDISVFAPSPNGVTAMYSGFPYFSQKTQALSLIRFGVQYFPSKNDLVIGIVKIRTSQTFILDIGAPLDAVLGGLQFDGVTKRNKPNIKVGAAVFCRVTEYSKHTGGKLSCINKGYSSKKNNQMGELKDGYVFWLPQYRHHAIQTTLLQRIGKCVKFDVAFGKNGKIWVNSSNLNNTMLIVNMFKMISNGTNCQDQKIGSMISMLK